MESRAVDDRIEFEEVCRMVEPIAIKHEVIRMYMFGSRVRGDGDNESDFDFCVEVPKTHTLINLSSLLNDLEIALGKKVDLVCEETLSRRPSFMEEVLHDRKLVFESRYQYF